MALIKNPQIVFEPDLAYGDTEHGSMGWIRQCHCRPACGCEHCIQQISYHGQRLWCEYKPARVIEDEHRMYEQFVAMRDALQEIEYECNSITRLYNAWMSTPPQSNDEDYNYAMSDAFEERATLAEKLAEIAWRAL